FARADGCPGPRHVLRAVVPGNPGEREPEDRRARVNPWHDARLLNMAANLLFGLTLLACTASGLWWVSQLPYFTLRTVEVEPQAGSELRYVSPSVLRSIVQRELRGNFFATGLDEVREIFESVPWVRRASVRR